MRRVHRSLDAHQVKQMRDAIASQLPTSDLPIGKVIRDMRISIKRSQEEYAKLCGVAPRALADIEAGTANPTLRTCARYYDPSLAISVSSDSPMRSSANADRRGWLKSSGKFARPSIAKFS